MSEPIPESIPTSADPRSQRPTKRRALTPNTAQAASVDALFAKPDRDIHIPSLTSKTGRTLAPPPEIVANVQGSSAGAGSGEFHVYKASRRREYERLRLMDEEARKEEDTREFERKREEMRRKDEEKTGKNRARREKAKMRKAGKKSGGEGAEKKDGVGKPGPNVKALESAKAGMAEEENGDAKEGVEEVGIVIHDDD